MTERRRLRSLTAGLALMASAAFAGFGLVRLDTAAADAERAQQQFSEAREHARTIVRYSESPGGVADQEIETTLLARLIEQAADQSGVGSASLERIWPQPARRVGDTAYLRKGTQIILQEVTLPDAVSFMHRLATTDPPLSIDALRMNPGRSTGKSPAAPAPGPETWTIELTISYLIYRPIEASTPK